MVGNKKITDLIKTRGIFSASQEKASIQQLQAAYFGAGVSCSQGISQRVTGSQHHPSTALFQQPLNGVQGPLGPALPARDWSGAWGEQ